MANTDPVNDSPAVTEFILKKALKEGSARVLPVGAVTKGLKGKELAEMGEMMAAGAIAASDDGMWITDARLMRRALEYARGLSLLIISHPEDPNLTRDGAMHEGEVSTRLGLGGMPAQAEEMAVARELSLLSLTGGRIHFAHVSTRGAVQAIRRAKEQGLNATAEATPHHFTLTHEATSTYDPDFKMNPPLRTRDDVDALREGLADGTIDVIATDHAPHAPWEKVVEFVYAPFGVVGLETALSLTMRLVDEGVLGLLDALARLTIGPARILGIDGGKIAEGAAADLVLFDPGESWVVDPETFFSKARNSPFKGMSLKGRVVLTLFGGSPVHDPRRLLT
jgi:dihydroorotase